MVDEYDLNMDRRQTTTVICCEDAAACCINPSASVSQLSRLHEAATILSGSDLLPISCNSCLELSETNKKRSTQILALLLILLCSYLTMLTANMC